MGIFDFLKKKQRKLSTDELTKAVLKKETAQIPEEDKEYYREDSYYVSKPYEGTIFEQQVISFEERKQMCIPSKNGLYVSEILLLEYCSKGWYPKPKYGYPAFWWFEHGIRDVGAALKSLEDRGFIEYASIADSVANFTVPQLKELLKKHGEKVSGRKKELVERVIDNVPEQDIIDAGLVQKYVLTSLGQEELKENEYVTYMNKNWTALSLWEMNNILGTGDKSRYLEIINETNAEYRKKRDAEYENLVNGMKDTAPETYALIRSQDLQLAICQAAQKKYKNDNDLDWIINFWESIWEDGGPLFEGSVWMFKLPDYYIQAGRYDDAIAICEKIKKRPYGSYQSKADSYIDRIIGLMKK